MSKVGFIQEDLRTDVGTQGQLLIARTIHAQIWPEVEKALLPRELAALFIGPGQVKGSSYDLNRDIVGSLNNAVRLAAEGAELWKEDAEFNNLNIKPDKYGLRMNISREMLEDANQNLLAHASALAARRFAENMTNKIISQSLDSAANTVAGGAAISIANITRAMQHLEDKDFMPTDFILGAEVANDIRNIDTFAEANKFGSNEMLQRGFIGVIYGMRVWRVSTNAGMTTTSSYVLDRGHAYVVVEKRPVTVEAYNLPTHDAQGVALTHRFKSAALRTNAIAKITTS